MLQTGFEPGALDDSNNLMIFLCWYSYGELFLTIIFFFFFIDHLKSIFWKYNKLQITLVQCYDNTNINVTSFSNIS